MRKALNSRESNKNLQYFLVEFNIQRSIPNQRKKYLNLVERGENVKRRRRFLGKLKVLLAC